MLESLQPLDLLIHLPLSWGQLGPLLFIPAKDLVSSVPSVEKAECSALLTLSALSIISASPVEVRHCAYLNISKQGEVCINKEVCI